MQVDRNDVREPLTVFSVYRAERSDAENEALHRGALLELKRAGARVSVLDGCYRGVRERSIMVVGPTFAQSSLIRAIAARTLQESILLISITRAASLLYVESGRHEHLGQLECVPMAEAMLHDAWSRNAEGYYFVVRQAG